MEEKKFQLDEQNAIFEGLCSGLAKYLGIKTWVTRVAAFCLACLDPIVFGGLYYATVIIMKHPEWFKD